MKILLMSIGTRGDMEPLLAIGALLAEAGHNVRCVMPAQFEELVSDTGLEFCPLDKRFLELLDTQAGQAIMGQKGGAWSRLKQYVSLVRQSMKLQKQLIAEQRDYLLEHQPDVVLYHPKTLYGRMFGMANPGKAIAISPIANWLNPVEEYPHVAFTKNLGKKWNKRTYQLVNWITAKMTARMGKDFKEDLNGLPFTGKSISDYMKTEEQVWYMVSNVLFPRPHYWPERARVMGYLERTKTNNWQPDQALLNFLKQYESQKKLLFTFGSMVNSDPQAKTETIIKVTKQLNTPAILITFSGGLLRPENIPDHILVLDQIPYDWIFPKMYAVIHHGGSGTTHTTLKHGCASLVCPHIIDQFFWDKRCVDLGVGPKGIPIKRVNENTLFAALKEILDNSKYKESAEQVAHKMKEEGNIRQRILSFVS